MSDSERKPQLLTPAAREGSQIGLILWLPKARAVREGARGIRDPLEMSLGADVVLDFGLQGRVVPGQEGVDDLLQGEGGVPSPRIKVVRVVFAG